ncbi:MAG: PAS domain-containing protein [Deltaproteobacteria bacterium]|nr:PAS domain-containing protein [Deltaproteobacteria bacterium]
MIVSWSPVVWMDMIGSSLSLLLGFWCTRSAWLWRRQKPDDIFRDYIFLLTLAFAFFVVSRSFSHLIKQILLLNGLPAVWADIAPFSGATNTASFIVIFAFGVYFQRFQRVHLELEDYKNNLEELVAERTCELKDANRSLEKENRQRRQAEEGLRQASATLENVFMSASPLCITAVDYELVEANNAYLEIWPNPRQDHESVKCYESRPGDLCHTAECPLEQVIHGREEVTCEAAKLARDGSEKIFLQTTRPFRDADGNLIGTVTSFQDITARKRAMKELAAERERLSVTLRSIGDGVITTDLEGRVLMLNKVAEKLCGWSQQEAMGRPLIEVFRISNERTGESCENPVEQVLATGHAKQLANHTVLLARDGRSYCIADSAAPIRDAESKVIGVVLVFRDVTEKKRMEEELLKTEKLKSVGLLAGGIAHDFNNILAAILGNIDLAIHRLGSDRVAVPLLAEAEKASLRAKDLTQQLLTFAKGGSPVLRTVSIAGIIRDSALFILRGSNVDCKMDIPDDLWLVDIDPGQMSQVIQNMTLNARQVMPDGGTVVIACRNHRERSARSHRLCNWVEITIADQGPGVDPGVVDRIFDPYFSTKQGGCGLGLSICHSIITQHKGRIKVSSAPEGGAVFVIQLPASTSVVTSEQQVKLEAQGPRQEGGRILVMDDDVLVANIAREILVTLGYEPVVVKDGREAIRAYKQAMADGEKFDAVIMDLTIPGGMGGKKAVGEVLALDPAAKVIVSSGYSNDPVMAFFQEHGFCAAIAKPFLVDELQAVIGRVLNS